MRILLAFAGSRGDAQPGVLLGRELWGRGHDVTVAVSPNLVEFAERHGVPAVPFGLDSDVLLRAQRDDRRFRHPNPLERGRALVDLQRRGFREGRRDLRVLADGHDIVVTGMACEEMAVEVAHHHDIPVAAVHFFPIRPSGAVPAIPTAWGRFIPGPLNRRVWQALTAARAWALAGEIAALDGTAAASGSDLRFPAIARGSHPRQACEVATIGRKSNRRSVRTDRDARIAIQAYDAGLFPGLANELRGLPFTGFPVLTDDFGPGAAPDRVGRPDSGTGAADDRVLGPDPELAEWLIAGTAPVYAGFGSMPVADPVAVESMVREVGRRLGVRVLLVGTMFRGRIAPDLAVVDQVDHRAVLPLCGVAVHHGGAGTTAAVLRAGVPSVICSVQADQPYWGRQLEALGLGATAPFAGLTADRLERLLIRATTPEVRLRAAAYGARFRDDGVRRAADVVESLSPERPRPVLGTGELSASTMIGGVR
ncbi:glycosyltransferase [Nocardia sp. NPDC059764]|uniref:glycosyltransferase n=1 Tax=Nocardia sp. NPDC059764 TaxID=3346939 RepID=UPI003654C342